MSDHAPAFTGTQTFTVTGMTCSHCERAVAEELGRIDGVTSVAVDLATGTVTVQAPYPIERDQIAGAVDEAGYALTG
jgi:copper ion binding protein